MYSSSTSSNRIEFTTAPLTPLIVGPRVGFIETRAEEVAGRGGLCAEDEPPKRPLDFGRPEEVLGVGGNEVEGVASSVLCQ